MTHDQFTKRWLGRYYDFPNTSDPNQCMDIMRLYEQDVWGVNPYVIPRAVTAKQAYHLSSSNNIIKKIPNTPNGIPKRGDLIFFRTLFPYTGLAGHVGIVDSADLYNVTVFHQNYPGGSPCSFKRFKYRYFNTDFVLGWIHKR